MYPNSESSSNDASADNQKFLRRDFLSAHVVEVGISLQEQFGTKYAAAYLKDNFIHLDIATRVLLNPAQRRRYN